MQKSERRIWVPRGWHSSLKMVSLIHGWPAVQHLGWEVFVRRLCIASKMLRAACARRGNEKAAPVKDGFFDRPTCSEVLKKRVELVGDLLRVRA